MILLKKIRLFIGWVHEIIRVGIRNRNLVQEHKVYLKDGLYKNSLRGDYIYEKSSRSYLRGKTYSSLIHFNSFVDSILYLFVNFFTYRVSNKKESKFHGTEMILSSSLTEVKIFDFKSQEVLTKYRDVDKLKRLQIDKGYFGKYFNVPETISLSIIDRYIIEKFIPHVKFEPEAALQYFCEKFTAYIIDIRDTVIIDKEGDQKRNSIFANQIGNSEMLVKIVGLPKLMVHGDFWSYNVIYDGNKYYLIDYEKKGVKYFLYDFFCFIFSEITLLKDSHLLKSYINGDYDVVLSKMFDSVGIRFEDSMRGEYFVAFLVEIFNDRSWPKELSETLVGGLLRTYIPIYYS